jgi:prepilin-type N-terminal cleavage/methylation domain-containing protein
MKRVNNKGFTIIELLIATVIFSLILLVITGAIVQFGRIYYRGIVQSRTQERSRAITESIAKNLQFSHKSSFSSTPGCYTVGNQSYTFNEPLPSNTLLLKNGGCDASGGTQLLGERMQLVALDVADPTSTGSYTVHARVVYGAAEDFESDDVTKPCKPIIIGGQFCAVSELTTTVVSRLK